MNKTIHSDFSGHTLFVQKIEDVPTIIDAEGYTEFYAVRNFDAQGVIFMYLGKGLKGAEQEIVVWYPNGQFWSSYGATFKEAIEGAQQSGWLYTK